MKLRYLTNAAAVLTGALACSATASAQAVAGYDDAMVPRLDLSLGYNHVNANAPPGVTNYFGPQGGYVSVSWHLAPWLAIAGEATGGHASNISTLGQNLTLITYAGGPRFTWYRGRFSVFGQALFGAAHASDSYFPTSTGYTTSASSFAIIPGGGVDFALTRHIAIRPLEVSYMRTTFPNGSTNEQNHLLTGAGITLRFGGGSPSGQRYSAPPPPPPPPPAPVVEVPPPPPPPAPPTPPPADNTAGNSGMSPAEVEFHANVPDALFDYDSAVIRPDAQQAIDHAAEYLNAHPGISVLVGGYADERGSAEYNLGLGQERASAARTALINAGVSPNRIQTMSYGKEAPVCTEMTEACWQRNRRAAFHMKP